MKSTLLFAVILPVAALACGGNEPAAQTPTTTAGSASAAPAESSAPATTASAAPSAAASAAPSATPATTPAPAVDLSTADKARTAIYEALKRGDKDGFKKLVTKRILDRQKDQFDAWFGVWKAAADKGPDKFKKITVNQEDGQFKLDEN